MVVVVGGSLVGIGDEMKDEESVCEGDGVR